MSFWSANPRQSQDRLKVLPGASRDFHHILDEILVNSETLDKTYSNNEPVCERGNEQALNDIPIDKNNNNSNREVPFIESNISQPNIKCSFCPCHDQLYDLSTNTRLATNLIQTKSCPDFPAILNMGTTCSTNAYDHRDWHNVADGYPLEHSKQGRRSRKKQAPGNDGESNCLYAGPVCTCNASTDAVDASEGLAKTHTDKQSWLSLPNGSTDTQAHNETNNRLSPIADSTGHIKLSRIFNSGRARATSSCDVSPHRLLTRRNNSPSGRSFTFDPRTSYADAMRQRSHSWSYSKYGSRPNYLKPASTARASVLSPPGQRKLMSSNSLQNTQNLGSQNKAMTTAKTLFHESCKKEAQVVHEASCPLHKASCEYIRPETSSVPDTSDTCLSPVMRQRSASESHTNRPRRILPRPTTGASNGQDHVHVRWADEEDGSSLSTSVLLSSVRPRSYSYGATDSAPHRPILKKVAGL